MIEILNLGINNIRSVVSAVESQTTRNVRVITAPNESRSPQLMILPGTGSFGAGTEVLRRSGLGDLILEHLNKEDFFLAGICLGMQLLGEASDESPGATGLGVIKASVTRLPELQDRNGRVPHVGWESITREHSEDFKNISIDGIGDVYFSHSYQLQVSGKEPELLWATSPAREFVAAIRQNNVSGYQFHPEKSSKAGLTFLKELLGWSHIEN